MTPAPSIIKCYLQANAMAMRKYPYRFGGGHDPTFAPSAGDPPGYDCSGWVSAILHSGGILEHGEPLATEELEKWGLSGRGQYMTVWVANHVDLHHCFLEFRLPGYSHNWSVARHTGTICGWSPSQSTEGYTPRRRR